MSTQKDVLEKVSNLIKLSQSPNEEEARTAAVQATRLMREHELVLVPKTELERVQKAMTEIEGLAKKNQADGMQRLIMGAALGALAVKQGLI